MCGGASMNYIWDLVIKANRAGTPMEKLTFAPAKSYSPYMELSNENINFKQVDSEIEINPYYRFYEIFKDLFNINNEADLELRKVLFDITIRFLTELDLRQGMNKTEYYLRFIRRDLGSGCFGPKIRDGFGLLDEFEQNVVTENVYRLLITGEMLPLLRETIRLIFINSTIYANYEAANELLFFIAAERTELNLLKLELIKELFLPLKFVTITYWKDHFGVIGMDETMRVDQIALY
jgi:hypothetical protein